MTSTRPRIAIVGPSLDILGGQGVQARAVAEALQRDGHPIAFVAINPRFPRRLAWVRRVPYLRTLLNEAMYLPSLLRLLRVDVVHVFSASFWSFLLAPVPAMLVARAARARVVLHYHSGEAAAHLGGWGPLVHPWLRLAHLVVVPSEYLAGVFARHGHAARVIRNVVDLTRFEYRARAVLRPRLLSTRNLEPYYRVDVVLKAFERVRAEMPGATLTVAGAGSEAPRLRRLAGPGVTFVGPVDPRFMPQLLAAADVFVNASVVDNQPVSILEAFASGLPVVSTPTGDIAAMVRHEETGLIVPPLDPASLADAVLRLLRDPALGVRLATAAREECAQFTWAAVRGQWASAYSPAGEPEGHAPEERSWMSARTR
jgi:glycosyltransferase involved in cell wall biosynthesis